jgi:hypothetical protein
MTQPEAESFSLSQHPTIDPFALLQALQLIKKTERTFLFT